MCLVLYTGCCLGKVQNLNERILKLRTQAAAWVAENHQPQDPNAYSQKEIDQRYLMYEEKFAELIVRECLSIIERRKRWIDNENGNTDNLWTHGYEKAINHCSMFIKEYLGVYE